MPQYSTQLALPAFRGFAKWLILTHLALFFLILIASVYHITPLVGFFAHWPLDPAALLHNSEWQALTYGFIHPSPSNALFELLTLWFLMSFLESERGAGWVASLYFVSLIGTALTAALLSLTGLQTSIPITGSFSAILALLIALGLLYPNMQLTLLFIIHLRARTMAILVGLIAFALLLASQPFHAFAQLGGALAGFAFIRFGSRRGLLFELSEAWYGLRNSYYRRKRRNAAKKFEVYMKQQGRTIRVNGAGQPLDKFDENDKKHWN